MGRKLFILAALVAVGVMLGFAAVRYKDYVLPLLGMHAKDTAALAVREPSAAVNPLRGGSDFASLVQSISPSVVSISASGGGTDYSRGATYEELGAGIIVSAEGHVATSAHLVSGAESITVTLGDRRSFSARVVGLDSLTDLAVVRIDAPAGLMRLAWADSDRARAGDFVLAVGNPFGLEHSVTLGIVSARGRARIGQLDEEFIQTDAAINPGNSGGPLLDSSGAVLGVVTGAYPQSGTYPGIGFAVPSNTARPVIEALMRDGRVRRGWIGAASEDMTPELAAAFGYKGDDAAGAVLTDVAPGGPAERAGLKRGDIIIEFGGHKVESSSSLGGLVALTPPGEKRQVTLFRSGRKWGTALDVAESPESTAAEHRAPPPSANAPTGPFWGLGASALTEDISRQLGLRSADRYGVVVASVAEGSPASRAGIRRGDVIQSIGGRRINTPSEFSRVAGGQRASSLVFVNRGSAGMFYAILSAR